MAESNQSSCRLVCPIIVPGISFFIPKIWAVKVAVKLRSCRNKVVFRSPIVRGQDTTDFGLAFSLTSEHVAVHRAYRVAGEKRR